MAKRKKSVGPEQSSQMSTLPEEREVNYDILRSIAQAVRLKSIETIHFSAQALRPLLGVHPSSLHQRARFRSEPLPVTLDHILFSSVEFQYEAIEASIEHDEQKVCSVHGTIVVVYEFSEEHREMLTTNENVETFAEVNSMVHAWPYIRECVGSCAARVGLSGVVLPVWVPPRQLPPKGEFTILSSNASTANE